MEAQDAQQVADAIRQTGRKAAAKKMHATEYDCLNAADTIERLQKEFQAMKDVADKRGQSFARAIEDFNNMRDQRDDARNEAHAWSQNALRQVGEIKAERDAALAEVKRLKGENKRLADAYENALDQGDGIDTNTFEDLLALVEKYEEDHYPVDHPTPIEAIKFRMEQQGLRQKDVISIFGSRSKASEVLAGKRRLSIAMLRRAHDQLGIPYETLLPKRDWL